jgi:hypothetical protein
MALHTLFMRIGERAAEMRSSSKELKDNNTAALIMRLAGLYDRLADRAESRRNDGVPLGKNLAPKASWAKVRPSLVEQF